MKKVLEVTFAESCLYIIVLMSKLRSPKTHYNILTYQLCLTFAQSPIYTRLVSSVVSASRATSCWPRWVRAAVSVT